MTKETKCNPYTSLVGVRPVMAEIQLERIQSLNIAFLDEVEEADVIVDALFGAGLSRDLDERTRKIIVQLEAIIQSSLAFTTGAKAYSGGSYAMLPTDLIEEIGKLEKNSRTV